MAMAHGLKPFELSTALKVQILVTPSHVEAVLSPLLTPLDDDPNHCLCISLDAEWNVSRTVGVSILQIAPHSEPDSVYIIPVGFIISLYAIILQLTLKKQIHKFDQLPSSLLRLLVNDRVFKIGSAVKADLTRLKKQFLQLAGQTSFNTIDLKEYAIQRGVIGRKQSGTLDILLEKLLGMFLSKDESIRRSDQWEASQLSDSQIQYAVLDVVASRCVFQKASEIAPLEYVQHSSPPGTHIGLHIQKGGEVVAYGTIAEVQPLMLGNVRVKVPTRSRLVINVDTVLVPSAAAILHLLPSQKGKTGKTKAEAFTLGQLQAASVSSPFQIVSPISLLTFDLQDQVCLICYPKIIS